MSHRFSFAFVVLFSAFLVFACQSPIPPSAVSTASHDVPVSEDSESETAVKESVEPQPAVVKTDASVEALPTEGKTDASVETLPTEGKDPENSAPQPAEPIEITEAEWVDGNNLFAIDLFHRISNKDSHLGKNVLISSYSIERAFGLLEIAAKGETKREILKAMRLPQGTSNAAEAGRINEQSLLALQAEHTTLSIANAFWIQSDMPILKSYKARAKQAFNASAEAADFANNAERERAKINAWVGKQTRNKIIDILPPGSVNALTRAILVNAIYFKSDWAKAFSPRKTQKDAPFYTQNGEVKVDMMHADTQNLQFGELSTPRGSAKALLLPYKSTELAMMFIWNDPETGAKNSYVPLESAYNSLSYKSVRTFISNGTFPKVNLSLPKFKIESSFNLTSILKDMGLKGVFSGNPDFSNLTTSESLYVSDVFHKTFIEVDETGTEAAAATAIGIKARGIRPPELIIPVVLDHPFLFAIVHKPSCAMLFLGKFEGVR